MKLDTEFYRLPLRFDAARLAEEVAQFDASEWRDHPQGFAGNAALIFVSQDGEQNDRLTGPFLPTPLLDRCPYVRQVLSSFQTVVGRTRLMRLESRADVAEHNDIAHYWHYRVRIHVPIVTDPSVRFWCNGKDVHMAAGDAWIFDAWKQHKVTNDSDVARIHLVCDTSGSSAFWRLVRQSYKPYADNGAAPAERRLIAFDRAASAIFATESAPPNRVMSPAEVDHLLDDLVREFRGQSNMDAETVSRFEEIAFDFRADWRAAWLTYGDSEAGIRAYQGLRQWLVQATKVFAGRLPPPADAPNGSDGIEILNSRVIAPLVNDAARTAAHNANTRVVSTQNGATPNSIRNFVAFDRPIILLSAPRAGSTLLFESLAKCANVWTIGGESHQIIESIGGFHPSRRNFDSNALDRSDLDDLTVARIRDAFAARLRDREGSEPPDGSRIRFLEKTPKNALRIPFIDRLFPDALFVFLQRDARSNLGSMIDAWQSGQFVTYPRLPDWNGPPWSLLLIAGWRQLRGAPIAKIVAAQWAAANASILAGLRKLDRSRWTTITYESLLDNPVETVRGLARFASIEFDLETEKRLSGPLPHASHTLSAPNPEKWRRHESEIEAVMPELSTLCERLMQECVQPVVNVASATSI